MWASRNRTWDQQGTPLPAFQQKTQMPVFPGCQHFPIIPQHVYLRRACLKPDGTNQGMDIRDKIIGRTLRPASRYASYAKNHLPPASDKRWRPKEPVSTTGLRRVRDSNPRGVAACLVSGEVHSSSLPTLRTAPASSGMIGAEPPRASRMAAEVVSLRIDLLL